MYLTQNCLVPHLIRINMLKMNLEFVIRIFNQLTLEILMVGDASSFLSSTIFSICTLYGDIIVVTSETSVEFLSMSGFTKTCIYFIFQRI